MVPAVLRARGLRLSELPRSTQVRPPIRPCRGLRRPAHRVNFDYKFTKLSVATPVEGPLPDFVESELEETTWGFVR